MARGTSLLALLDMLREELGRSTNVGVGLDDIPSLKRHLNRSYALIYDDHDWQHLRHVAPRIALNAGQRYYDFPATLDFERVEEINAWFGGQPYPLEKGIASDEYAIFDSGSDVRADPPQKWDMQYSGTAPQIEIWPIPASNSQQLELIGIYKIGRLVNDEDICLLDDELVVLTAAVRLLGRQKSEDAKLAVNELNSRLVRMKARAGPARRVIMGGAQTIRSSRRTVSIAGRA